MSRAVDRLNSLLTELRDERATLRAKESQIAEDLKALQAQVHDLQESGVATRVEINELQGEITATQALLAQAEEHAPQEIEPVDDTPVVPDSPPVEAEATPERKGDGNHPHYSRDPLHVNQKNSPTGRKMKSGIKRARLTDGPSGNIKLEQLSPTDEARADLLYELLVEKGPLAQSTIAAEIGALLECIPGTAQVIASRSIDVLLTQHRVVYTGDKDGSSAIWRVCDKSERAAAGVPVEEDDFQGRTSTINRYAEGDPERPLPGSYESGR